MGPGASSVGKGQTGVIAIAINYRLTPQFVEGLIALDEISSKQPDINEPRRCLVQIPENGQVVLITQKQPITAEMVKQLLQGTNKSIGNRCHRCGRFKEEGICSCQVTG